MKTIFIIPPATKPERRQLRTFAIDSLTQAQTNFEIFQADGKIPEHHGFIVPLKNTDNHGEFYMYRIDGFGPTESQCVKFYISDDDVVIKYMYMFKYAGVYLDITKKDWAKWLYNLVIARVEEHADELKKAMEAQTKSDL